MAGHLLELYDLSNSKGGDVLQISLEFGFDQVCVRFPLSFFSSIRSMFISLATFIIFFCAAY